MPSAMIHLLVAREIPGGDAPLFCLGSLAPDYLSRREEKDAVHLRREPDRYQALLRLAEQLDRKDPFEAGWLVHLLADLRWDTAAPGSCTRRSECAAGKAHGSGRRCASH